MVCRNFILPEICKPCLFLSTFQFAKLIVPYQVNCTPLVLGLRKHFSHSLQHTKALVANNEFNAVQATATEPLEETDPAGFVLLHAFGSTKNLAVAILVHRNGYQRW